ncbi:MAG: hypothetical protein ACK4FB_04620 [Brevundimonas sp.]|uniref:hypothetical protein n=1 Tax=Brevundimonas sp. TaxID=1871086 RepID=UPI00391CFDFA
MIHRRGVMSGLAAAGASFALARPALGASLDEREPVNLLFQEGRYAPLLRHLRQRADVAEESERNMAMQYWSLLGDERRAGRASWRGDPSMLDGVDVLDAADTIADMARDHRIVILNEAHDVSAHRAFAGVVARRLRSIGYGWYAAETFNPVVRDFQVGSSFLTSHGFYSMDPVFAEVVRDAVELGYRLADYEIMPEQRTASPDASRGDRIAEREEAQALNLIANVLDVDPEARVFVHCGYSHAAETPLRDVLWFAGRLKEKTGIDPLTINQSQSWPGPDIGDDTAMTTALLERIQDGRPVVLRRPDGTFVHSADHHDGAMDLTVAHPRYAPVDGRPGWLASDRSRRRLEVTLPAPAPEDALIQAVRHGEEEGAVPSDHYPLEPGQTAAALYLKPGGYKLRIETPEGYAPLGDYRV